MSMCTRHEEGLCWIEILVFYKVWKTRVQKKKKLLNTQGNQLWINTLALCVCVCFVLGYKNLGNFWGRKRSEERVSKIVFSHKESTDDDNTYPFTFFFYPPPPTVRQGQDVIVKFGGVPVLTYGGRWIWPFKLIYSACEPSRECL